MVALKATEVDAFVARPDPARPIVLVFGPDAGLVRERAEALVHASVDDPRDPFALVRLEGDALAAEPSRLVEEANTVPLFGGRRAVWVKAGGRNFAAAVEAVLATPPQRLPHRDRGRRSAPQRAAARGLREGANAPPRSPAIADGERDLVRLIDDEMREAGLTIAPDARAALVSLIGGDRQASRSEIRKLALYAHGKDRVELDDVLAVVADASALALDAVVDAAFAGRAARHRGAVRQGARRRHRAGHDPVVGAAPRGAAAQGAARGRCRRGRRRGDAQLHPADPFPPQAAVEAALKILDLAAA